MPTIAGLCGVILANLGSVPVTIERGDRIAQLVVAPVSRAQFDVVDELPESVRGDGGFGTGDGSRRRSMKVYIVGRGAVGRYLGDKLESIGVEVAYAPRALDAVTPFDADVAIVATKAYDTEGAIATLRKAIAVSREVRVRLAAKRRRQRREARGSIRREQRRRCGAHRAGRSRSRWPCAVQPKRRPRIRAGGRERVQLAHCDVREQRDRVNVVADWRALKWSKLALNVVANASCAILNVLPKRFGAFEKMLRSKFA